MWLDACSRARRRLPLLAGGDLIGADRRAVERHLVGCPACRDRLSRLRAALGVLETAGQIDPVGPEAPSLWPNLARQIREDRRPRPATSRAQRAAWMAAGLAASLLIAGGALAVRNFSKQYRLRVTLDPVRPTRKLHRATFRRPLPASEAGSPLIVEGRGDDEPGRPAPPPPSPERHDRRGEATH